LIRTAFLLSLVVLWVLTTPVLAQSPPKAKDAKSRAPAPPGAATTTGPTYFVIPFKGTVGKELLASKVKEAMAAGLKDGKTVLVLDFDSPGGRISECEEILGLLAEHKGRRTIALVKNAYSAAAILALSCDEIYMLENSSIGSAQAITISAPQPPAPPPPPPPQTPRNADPQPAPAPSPPQPPPDKPATGVVVTEAHEKVQSVWRSICRRAAELGGHNPLLAEAMADPGVQIRLVEKDGKMVVEQFLTAKEEDVAANRILKTTGKLLTLTGREAVNCGLAVAVVDRLGDVETKASGLAGWKPVNDRGQKIMDAFRIKVEKAEKSFEELAKTVNEGLRHAVIEDPAKKSYSLDGSGTLTPAGYKLLVKQCQTCAAHLNQSEQALRRIAELGKSNPFLEEVAEEAQEIRAEIRASRDRIRVFASRFRLPAGRKLGL